MSPNIDDVWARVDRRLEKMSGGDGMITTCDDCIDLGEELKELEATATRRKELLVRAMNALEGWRILLDMPITDIMTDIEKELADE